MYDFGNGPVPAHRHPNGGGWVAETAMVSHSAYVGIDSGRRSPLWAYRGIRSRLRVGGPEKHRQGDGRVTDDEMFADMAAQLFDIEDPDDVDDVSTLDVVELAARLRDLDHQLVERCELLAPTTEEGRELHSRRTAVMVCLKKRRT